ncbi:hypothetical protein [Mycolicibacterium palauense]|uniref:hypothetical protein n=1 Tax=Mycolicibacterium palauense TaxID=2034511 RepID=UPI000BFEDC1D|nr:hypothetical protein [Mycolicibacterium palauense]
MTVLVVLAKVILIAFLVLGTATFVVTFFRRRRRRGPLPPWPPTGPVYYGQARLPLPPWLDEYGNVADPDGTDEDRSPGKGQAGQA